MIEPQPPIAALRLDKNSDSAETITASDSAEFDFETISKTILKLTDWVVFESNSNSAVDLEGQDFSAVPNFHAVSQVSPIIFDAWESLVKIVAHLLSTASGWPSNLPRTPDNIVAYVTEEACEVLDAIKREILSKNLDLRSQTKLNDPVSRYILIKDLIPRLLWYIARSSDDMIRLLTGVEARVSQSDQGWSSGILRLAAILTLDNTVAPWSIDLVTNQPLRSCLNSDTMIQWNDCYYSHYPISSEQLLQQLLKRIKEVNPEIIIFTDTTKIDFLKPGENWQCGNIQLSLGFEFIVDTEIKTITQISKQAEIINNANINVLELDSGLDVDLYLDNYFTHLSAGEIQFKITDPESIGIYYVTIMQQQLAALLCELPIIKMSNIQDRESTDIEVLILDFIDESLDDDLARLENENESDNLVDRTPDLQTESFIISVVTSACEVAKRFEQGAELSAINARSPQMLITDLTLKLLWDIIHSSYEVMQIVGGVRAQVLQPEGDWQTGTLCLVAILQVDAGHSRCNIDVATGQSRNSNTKLLVSKAIATSQDSDLCKEPVELGNLAKRIIRKLRESSPEIALWMDGMVVELRSAIATSADSSETNWQSGAIKLSIGFELLGEKSFHI